MIKVGLTGNIGSGKTLVAKIFETLSVPVFYADLEAKKILNRTHTQTLINEAFGGNLIVDKHIDRKALAAIVFKDKEKLALLNSIIHPAVRTELVQWIERHARCSYIVYETAILFESGFAGDLDKVILVTAEEKLRTLRVMQRDNVNRELVAERMKNQWPEAAKRDLSDFSINNNEDELLIPQVLKIHNILSNQV